MIDREKSNFVHRNQPTDDSKTTWKRTYQKWNI